MSISMSAPRHAISSSMSRRDFVSSISRGIGAAIVGSTLEVSAGARQTSRAEEERGRLFNGKDLSGFYTFLRDFGKNNDPKNVFTVRDGMIRISGEIDGALMTEREYENYRVLVEFQWGDVMWRPRIGRAMDSGLFLHCGEDGASGGAWPDTIEFNIYQGATGDFILLAGRAKVSLTVEGEQRGDVFHYVPGAPAQLREAGGGRGAQIIAHLDRDPEWKSVRGFRGRNDVEKPHGEWNVIEAICDGDTITNIVNGKVVNKGTRASRTRGRIGLQSEGSEVFFRRLELHPLPVAKASA